MSLPTLRSEKCTELHGYLSSANGSVETILSAKDWLWEEMFHSATCIILFSSYYMRLSSIVLKCWYCVTTVCLAQRFLYTTKSYAFILIRLPCIRYPVSKCCRNKLSITLSFFYLEFSLCVLCDEVCLLRSHSRSANSHYTQMQGTTQSRALGVLFIIGLCGTDVLLISRWIHFCSITPY